MKRNKTVIQRLQSLGMTMSADEQIDELEDDGYEIVSEHLLMSGETLTRVLRLKPRTIDLQPESVIGKLVREHGAERANVIMQQESIDRARGAYEGRRAHYRNNSIPLPAFPVQESP